MFDLLLGTVQGSILGPELYAIFVSPLFDLEELFAFADDTFIPRISDNANEVVPKLERSLETIIKWMKQSGLKINEDKTEVCCFYKHNMVPLTIRVGNNLIETKDSINVLGVTFDTKLTWSKHVRTTVSKSN